MSRTAAATVALDPEATTVVRSAQRRGARVVVRSGDGRRLGVIVSAAYLEALEDAADAGDAAEALAEFRASGEAAIPLAEVVAGLRR